MCVECEAAVNARGLIKKLQALVDEDDRVGDLPVVFTDGLQRINSAHVIGDAEVLNGEKPLVVLSR